MRRSKFKNVALDGVILIFENCEFGVIPIESIEKIEFDYKNDTFSYTRINKDHLYSKITLKSLDIYGEYLHKLNPMFSEKMINKDKTLFERI